MGSTKIVELAEHYGLIDKTSISQFFDKTSKRDLARLDEGLREAVVGRAHAEDAISTSTFNYLASASFRGEQGCSAPECRARRMAEFSRFSLLYADKVVFPLYMPRQRDPWWLKGNFRVLAEIRPLLDIGIVVPTESLPCLCKSCFAHYEQAFQQVELAARNAADSVRVEYIGPRRPRGNPKSSEWLLRFKWPSEYDPAPPPLLSVNALPPPIAQFVNEGGKEGTQLPVELVKESGILMAFFEHASGDFVLHNVLNRTAGCVYLSDSSREVRQLEELAGATPEAVRNDVFASMAHNVPLFADIRIETLVQVRQQDGEAFTAYRAALNKAANEANQKGITPARSREIFFDIIQPKLSALERKYEVLRGRFRMEILADYGVPIAALAVGAISGASHPLMGDLLQVAGGLDLVKTLTKQFQSLQVSRASLDEVRSDPLYFLLRMKREHDKDCAT